MIQSPDDAPVPARQVLRLEHRVPARQELVGQRELLRKDVERYWSAHGGTTRVSIHILSRGAATECSPRREPRVLRSRNREPRRGGRTRRRDQTSRAYAPTGLA